MLSGGGKNRVQRAEGRLQGIAKSRGEPAGDRARRGHRHLLAEDRAHRHFEAVEGAGHAQARDGASASAPSACATSAGLQARSISALTRDSTGGSAFASDAETATRSAGFFGEGETSIQPRCSLPSSAMRTVRR